MIRNSYIQGLQYEAPHPFRTDSDRLAEQFFTDTIIEDGVVRWKKSGNFPPKDVLEFWKYLGYEFDYELTLEERERDQDEFLSNYRKNRKSPSQEELNEMRAAFGEGETVVDIITGEEIKL